MRSESWEVARPFKSPSHQSKAEQSDLSLEANIPSCKHCLTPMRCSPTNTNCKANKLYELLKKIWMSVQPAHIIRMAWAHLRAANGLTRVPNPPKLENSTGIVQIEQESLLPIYQAGTHVVDSIRRHAAPRNFGKAHLAQGELGWKNCASHRLNRLSVKPVFALNILIKKFLDTASVNPLKSLLNT